MPGSFSLKLLSAIKEAFDAGEKVLLVCRSKAAVQEYEEEIRGIFPEAPIEVATPATARLCGSFRLIAVILSDGLLGKDDFRADEHALQLFQQLAGHCTGLLMIQTRESSHPVFKALKAGSDALYFLPERKAAGFPPCTRQVSIVLRDNNLRRLEYLSGALARELAFLPTVLGPYPPMQEGETDEHIRLIRLMLPRDKALKQRKKAIAATVAQFEKERKYTGHIVIDVDPA